MSKKIKIFLSFFIFIVSSISFIFYLNQTQKNETKKELLMLKISHQKSNLSLEQKQEFQKLFHNKLKIIKPCKMFGVNSLAYLLEDKDKNKYILKIHNNKDFAEKHIKNQIYVTNFINKILKDYSGPIKVSQHIFYGNNYIIEKYLGEPFTEELYNNLHSKEQSIISKNIADFLNYLHHHKIPDFSYLNTNNILSPNLLITTKFLPCLKDSLSDQEYNYLVGRNSEFIHRDKSDEINVLVHGDLHSGNMLYNFDDQSVAYIDFELMSYGDIYYDFIVRPSVNGISFDLLFNIIDNYNKISNYKINKEKVVSLEEVIILNLFNHFGDAPPKFTQEDYLTIKQLLKNLKTAYHNNIHKNI